MTSQEIILKTVGYVQEKFKTEGSGHDWFHIERVWWLAKHIATDENDPDLLVVELGALLHDIADWKFSKLWRKYRFEDDKKEDEKGDEKEEKIDKRDRHLHRHAARYHRLQSSR